MKCMANIFGGEFGDALARVSSAGAALATVVGVLVDIPVMPSTCRLCTRTHHGCRAVLPDARQDDLGMA